MCPQQQDQSQTGTERHAHHRLQETVPAGGTRAGTPVGTPAGNPAGTRLCATFFTDRGGEGDREADTRDERTKLGRSRRIRGRTGAAG